ncbi:MAG: hypothetical protein J5632_05165 [Bacteroidales bacterium]|nr:hypothetical protein [Bacteroidales bacterium]
MKFSQDFCDILSFAREEAMRTGCTEVSADHLMLGMLRNSACGAAAILAAGGIDPQELKKRIDAALFHREAIPYEMADSVRPGPQGDAAINLAVAEAQKDDAGEVGALHLLRALRQMHGPVCSGMLREAAISASSPSGPDTKEYTPREDEINRLLGAFPVSTGIKS